ncbi:MAG: lipopolysaccharide core heptose(I) kinase RfaP [Pseudomonadota bacterium]
MPGQQLYLRADFQQLWQGQDPFAAAAALEGQMFRALEQRQTLAFNTGQHRFFIKRHHGVTWKEIFKNLVQLRLPVVGASNEFNAINKLQQLGIKVPVIAAYGKKGLLPENIESFLVTEDVGPHESLEDYCRHWRTQPPTFADKRALILQIADISRTMHNAGVCHRDFYICHLLFKGHAEPLTVIDLHRALIKSNLAERWVIKDVAGLYFSAMDIGLTRRDLYRFMKRYSNCSLREALTKHKQFWQAVEQRALRLYQKH